MYIPTVTTAMPTMSTPLATYLANEMDARGWTQRDMAEAAGFSHVGVGNILRGKTKAPDIKTLAAFAKALSDEQTSAATYFQRLLNVAGYSIEVDRANEVLARMESVLTESQRRRLMALPPEKFVEAINLILNLVDDSPSRQG